MFAGTCKFDKDIMILLVLGVVLVLAFYLYGQMDWQAEQYRIWDLHKYKPMAEAGWIAEAKVARPFCYRWLGPLLAGVMPFETITSFRVLNWFFCAAFVYLFYLFLRSRNYPVGTSFAVLLIVIFNKYFFGYFVWSYFQLPDVVTLVLVVLMCWALETSSYIWFGILLTLGAATKEPNMLMIPVAWLSIRRSSVSADRLKLLCGCLAAAAVFAAIRYLTEPAGGTRLLRAFALHSGKLASPEKLAKMFINVWAPVSFIPIIFFGSTFSFFKKRIGLLLFLLLVYFSNLFGVSTERLLAPAGVVVYWLLADIFENNLYEKKLVWLIVAAAIASCGHHEIGRFPLPSQQVTILLACGALLAASVIALYYRLSVQRQRKCR